MEPEAKWGITLIGVVVVGMIAFMLWSASQEAKHFDALTGAHATMWDALFTELRVQSPALPDTVRKGVK